MRTFRTFLIYLSAFVLLTYCKQQSGEQTTQTADTVATTPVQQVKLPEPYATESVKKYSKVLGWSGGQKPVAPEGFTVTKFAADLVNPRWIYQAPNGDIFVAEANTESKGAKKVADQVTGKAQSQRLAESADRITLLRDTNQDGQPDVRQVFLTDLNKPFGMLVLGNHFYVANTDGL
ncbi:MAG: sorbosone dehydrogenase family protein, partial [Cytophagales bacterium]|nr:sorbosone dehydrogenase family protein [Cytophagales bacterium]